MATDDSRAWSRLAARSWTRFARDDELLAWIARVRPLARERLADPGLRRRWLRCGGTWFAGVRALPNDGEGAVPRRGVPPLQCAAVSRLRKWFGAFDFDPGQVSACLPGYPRPGEEETEAAHRYRLRRHAAHVDGLARSPDGRRRLTEAHGFVLGIPLADAHPDASPLSVWEGSHELVREALATELSALPEDRWRERDVTDAYHAARRRCFEECRRVGMEARAGEAVVVHRLALHGIAPWRAPDGEPPRVVVYFRPELGEGGAVRWWLESP